MAADDQNVALQGRTLVMDEIERRGARANLVRNRHLVLLEVTRPGAAERVLVRVKTRTGGTWQGSIRDGDPDPAPHIPATFWAFVDLTDPRSPAFYIAPDDWVRRDIHAAHQEYLGRHGGERAISKDSTHHAIQLPRILQWRDRWDLIGL
jgi:hypothetical protein